jgi:L-ascorbate metabolism protein UlaG (beta-lactamase superfamily)
MRDDVSTIAVTWWGHASATVELGAARIATDPLLGDRLGHLRRYAASPSEDASRADVVLVSHLHHDHFHVPSLKRFGTDVPIVVPAGGERLLGRLTGRRVLPVEPGDELDVAGVRVEVLPATHDSRRGHYSRVTGPPLGFRVEAPAGSFWFPGDTELRDDMADIAPVDLGLVPIGGWGPTLADGHMHPEAGADAVARIGARWAVPVHWGTFWPQGLRLVARDNHHRLFVSPGERFLQAMAEHGPGTEVVLAAHGDRVVLGA